MADCCLIKKVATVEVYENKNEVRTYGFMAGDRNTPVMEVRFKHLWGESNLSSCKLRWIIVDDVGSLLVGEVPIQSDNTALINLPNELFTGDRRMKVQLTVASCDGERILNLQQFTDLKVINSLATNEVVQPVYQLLINQLYDDTKVYLSQLETSYSAKYGSLETLYANSKASLEQYLITAENGGNAEFLQGYSPVNFIRSENTINELVNSATGKYKVGDIVSLNGYYTAGDGGHHKRIAKDVDDGSGELGQNGIWWCVVAGAEPFINKSIIEIEYNTVRRNETTIYVTEIPKEYKPKIGYSSNPIEPSVFSKYKNASICLNGGLFNVGTGIPSGVTILDSKIITDYTDTFDSGTLVWKNDYILNSEPTSKSASELIGNGYTNAIRGSSTIVKNGLIVVQDNSEYHPRQIIGQKNNGDYVVLTCDGRRSNEKGLSLKEASEIMIEYGCAFAYNLDGGGSTGTVISGIKINKNHDDEGNTERKVPTFIYFSKDMYSTNTFDIFRTLNEVNKLKNYVDKKNYNLTSDSGVFKIKPISLSYPGIEVYNPSSETRFSKIGFDTVNKSVYIDADITNNGYERVLDIKSDKNVSLFGEDIGSMYGVLELISDIESVNKSGIYRVDANTTGKPSIVSADDFGSIIIMRHGTHPRNVIDLYFSKTNEGVICVRQRYGASTGTWRQFQLLNPPSMKQLDTPYYAYKMQQEGIYKDYVAYRDELHEYENSIMPEDATMLPVLQEPVIPESVRIFAEKYRLI